MPRLGSVLQERAEINVDGKVEQVLSVLRDIGVILYEEKGEIGNKRSEDITRYKIVRPDDLVVNSMNVIIGSVGLSKYTGCLSPVYYVLKPRREDVSSGYYGRVFQLKLFQESLVRLGNGILAHRMRIPMEKLKAEHIPLPPLDEQQAIVRYLDHIDRRIRRYIRAKQRLLALLHEQKQAIIHQAVTRGLDASAPLKPSGVAWLGEVPAHWERTRLKFVGEIQTGLTLGKVYLNDELEERPYLRVANVQSGYLNLATIATVRVPLKEAKSCELQPGDVLMTEGGDIDKLGRGYVWQGEIPGCLHQNHIFAVRVNRKRILPEFLVALMTSRHGRNYFQLTAKQTTNLASTNSTTLKAFPLLLPSIEEQQSILRQIATETSALDSIITKAQREIDLIREYRTRLIADVVTGKVDVRAAAAALPTEEGEAEENFADAASNESLGEEMSEAEEE